MTDALVRKKKSRPPKVIYTEHDAKLGGAIEDAFVEHQSLLDYMRTRQNNQSTYFPAKAEEIRVAADALAKVTKPNVPACIADRPVKFKLGVKKSPKSPNPQWIRRENMLARIEAAFPEIEAWRKEQKLITSPNHDAVEAFEERLTAIKTELAAIDFPGAYP